MTPAEVVRRFRDEALKQSMRLTRSRVVAPAATRPAALRGPVPLPGAVDDAAAGELIAEADQILAGRWSALGVERTDLDPEPDWFLDPQTGVRAPEARFSFDINSREPEEVGNAKLVWELSRHHHVTTLAAAYRVSGRSEFAEAASRHLSSWWTQNGYLSGIHWRSGIELGIRLIAWTWVRRLLDGWEDTADLFEGNPLFRDRLYQHLHYLARLPSHGSSANNHLVAEEAGRFVASCAFPWFPQSVRWREKAASVLRREAVAQTFPSGLNREQATGYHAFVLELLLAAAIEGDASGHPLGPEVWERIRAMTDALAATVDGRGAAPRQGDDDQGSALVLGTGKGNRWGALLATGAALFGPLEWWPPVPPADARTSLWTQIIAPPTPGGTRPDRRPSAFEDAGMVILRDLAPGPEEIWCRCDGGPHGFLGIASHAHADALSVEVRFGGVEVLADPGTYRYHTDPEWRAYFRSTAGHNTLELGGVDQSVSGGPFNWIRHAGATTVGISGVDDGAEAVWEGEHDGYTRLDPAAVHRRRVVLDREARRLRIEDRIACEGVVPVRLAFHLGPEVACRLTDSTARLEWDSAGELRSARFSLPGSLAWESISGRSDPPAGWYSPELGTKVPAFSLLGSGELSGPSVLVTEIQFSDGSGALPGRPI